MRIGRKNHLRDAGATRSLRFAMDGMDHIERRVTEAGQRNLKLLIAGGGTGGHVFPALAIAREWMSREGERQVVIVGTQRGIEARLVPEAGFPLETIRSAGLKGIGGMRLARNAAKLAPAMW